MRQVVSGTGTAGLVWLCRRGEARAGMDRFDWARQASLGWVGHDPARMDAARQAWTGVVRRAAARRGID